jgi:hypothetical protein
MMMFLLRAIKNPAFIMSCNWATPVSALCADVPQFGDVTLADTLDWHMDDIRKHAPEMPDACVRELYQRLVQEQAKLLWATPVSTLCTGRFARLKDVFEDTMLKDFRHLGFDDYKDCLPPTTQLLASIFFNTVIDAKITNTCSRERDLFNVHN